ncbi:unnamed protein product [Phytophthora fragariaefolia]|uniref:Unnamed protein product n=1 Tax=Phytophthora fragariaefolia TaxID=1490495 RepID=A0A9W7CST0_9STRA|nr:unnamed protein product [Phytophthora fragariaefolia]
MDHIVNAVKQSPSSNECVYCKDESAFKDYKFIVDDMYNKMGGIQSFQLVWMRNDSPGFVECRKLPADSLVKHDLRQRYDG